MSDPIPAVNSVSIKPRAGLRVRKPNGQLLNPGGESVTWSSYWRRRELGGDIELAKPKGKPKPAVAADKTSVE